MTTIIQSKSNKQKTTLQAQNLQALINNHLILKQFIMAHSVIT